MNDAAITPEDAFEVLQVAVQERLTALQQSGAEAMRDGDFSKAQQVLDQVRALHDMLGKIEALEVDYQRLVETPEQRADTRRLRKGLRTPDAEYVRPILESLVELGGSARIGDVLDRVYKKMRHILNAHDLAPVPSDQDTPRWRNAAQWVRYGLAQQGLLRNDSPRGVWEIADEGRHWLEGQG
jgi:restriction system protein